MGANTSIPLTILVVDSDANNQILVKNKFKSAEGWDLTIDSAKDGEEALQKLKDKVYDLVTLDYRLPGSDGIELMGKIRQLHDKSAVVMVTAAGNENIAVAAMKQGAMDYLTFEELRGLDVRQLFRRIIETRELVNQNMELRQINQMKTEFIANVSHELRTPLSVVLGYAKTMQDQALGPVNEQQGKAIDAIIERAEGLLLTLNQILKFREANEGKQQLLLKPVDLKALLADYASKPPKGSIKKKMKFETRLESAPVWVRADTDKLRDALDNLVSNAIKFGPESSTVTLSLATDGSQAKVTVSDEGPGIPPEFLPHLFETMFAAHRGPTREYPGLGLGLAITQQIIELHTGRVWLESQGTGLGTRAYISLPLAAKNSTELVVGRPTKGEKKRVLIVEDNLDLIDVLMLFMASVSPNLEVYSTTSGFGALESIGEKTPHLIILDVMMPGMSGLEVIERLRRLPETERIPVLVLTGYAEGAQMALKVGAKDVLLKPFEKNAFVKKVVALLRD